MAERRGRGQGASIMRKGNLEAKILEAQQILGLARRFFDDAAAVIDRLASHSPTSAQLAAYFGELYLDPQEGKENTRAVNTRSNLQRLFEEGVGHDQPGVKGTTWAAYNAVTEYVDHVRTARGRDDCDRTSRRLDSIWFGSGARLKAKSTGGVAATKHRGNPSRRRRTSATAPAGKRPPRLSEGRAHRVRTAAACWPNPRCGRTSTVPAAVLGIGHAALLLASGHLDGVVQTAGRTPQLVRGTSRKRAFVSDVTDTANPDGSVTTRTTVSERIDLPAVRPGCCSPTTTPSTPW